MKKLLTLVSLLIATISIHAQGIEYEEDDDNMFNHMSFGISAGTAGVGLDLAMPIGDYVQVRAGATYMPPFSYKTTLEANRNDKWGGHAGWGEITTNNKVNFLNGKIMFDLYPVPSFPLHITLGAFFGDKTIMEITDDGSDEAKKILGDMYSANASFYKKGNYEVTEPGNNNAAYKGGKLDANMVTGVIGPTLGSYPLLAKYTGISDDGKTIFGGIDSWIQTNWIRPYAGLGWGKARSGEKGTDIMIEAGVIFWDQPEVHSNVNPNATKPDETVDVNIPAMGYEASGFNTTKILTKIKLYPVISVRFGFNMF